MHFEKKGSGPPVVLIHGLGAYSFSWRDTAAALSKHYTTYAVDLLGFGQSVAPTGFAYTAKAQAEAVAAFITAHGLSNPSIVGHSMGGSVCLYLAAQPAKPGAPSIGKMVLIDAVAPELPAEMRRILANVSAVPATPDSPAVLARIKAKMILESAQVVKPEQPQIDGYAKGLSTPGQALALKEHTETLSAVSFSKAALGAIKTKTLVIWGEEDRWLKVAEQGVTLAAWLGNAKLERIKSCGHIPHEEQPTETNTYIADFLK